MYDTLPVSRQVSALKVGAESQRPPGCSTRDQITPRETPTLAYQWAWLGMGTVYVMMS